MPGFAMPSTARLVRSLLLVAATLALLIALPAQSATASGCTDTFTNTAGGSWLEASNWSTKKVPVSTDEVCITENGTYTVELKGAGASVKALTIGGSTGTQTLAVESSTSANSVLTTETGLGNGSHGVVVMTNGDAAGNNVTIVGPVSNAGSIKVEAANGGQRSIQGSVTNTGTLAVNTNTSYNGSKAVLTNEGAITVANEKALTVSNEGALVNGSGGSITTTGSGNVQMEPGTAFTEGAGTTSGTKPVIVRDAAIKYTGAGSSSIFAHGSGTLAGNISSGQTLTIESTSGEHAVETAAASLSNAGTVVLTNGDSAANNATLVMTSPATLSSSGSIKVETASGGQRSIQGNVTNTGTLAVNAGTSYNGTKATLTNEGAITVANEKALTVSNEGALVNGSGGSITTTGSGTVQMEPGTSFTEGAGTTSGTKPVIVRDGAVKYTGSGASAIAVHGSGTLSGNISSGQTLTIESTSGEHAVETAAASLSNAGTVVLTNGDGAGNNATLVMTSPATLSDTGSIDVEAGVGGQRSIQGNLVNTGTLAINTSTSYNGSKATLTNEGAIAIANEKALVVSNEGAVVNGAGGSIAAGTSGLLQTEPGTSFTEGAGTTSGTKPVIVRDGSLTYTGSGASTIAVHGSGSLAGNISAGQTLRIESTSGEHANETAAGSFSNAGTIVLTNGDGAGNNATLVVSAGTLTSGGTIDVEKANGGVRTIQGNLTNSGTVNINANTTYNASAVTLTNAGTINIATGVALSVTGKSTVANEAGGDIVVSGSGALVQTEGTFDEGAGKTTITPKTAEPVILDRVALHYAEKGGASKIAQEGAGTLGGNVGKGQTLVIESTCSEHAEDTSGALEDLGKIVLTNAGTCGNNVTLKLGGATLTNKGTLEVLWPHGGAREVQGSIVSEKTVTIANEASRSLVLSGAYTQTAKGQLKDTIAGATNFGRLSVGGAVAVGGKLALKQSKFTGKSGETFAIIGGASRTGEFATVTGNLIKNTTLHYIPHYTPTGVNLVVE
jgi:hypothetical protein